MDIKEKRIRIKELKTQLNQLTSELDRDLKILRDNCNHNELEYVDGFPAGFNICKNCGRDMGWA